MSKISLDLSSIKSAGVYTMEIDESQRTEAQVNALRLLVGFSGKGPFNRPVFLQNEGQRQKLFGDIDTKLEKKGCFFNRAAKTMLDNGSILALNLLKVDDSYDGPDQVNYAALSLDAGKKNPVVADAGITYGEYDYLGEGLDASLYGSVRKTIPFVGKTPYASLYDRTRFWTPSESNLMAVASNGLGTTVNGTFERANFINFANCGTDEISILVFKPENTNGYNITAKDWYGGEENIPFGWIRPSDYISDYFIRVIAVKGNWSNYKVLSADPTWGKYFDQNGILKDKIYHFSQAEGITFVGSWSGSIIPDFTDKQGNYLYIKDRVNSQTESTGLLMSINEDAMQVISYDLNGVDVATGETTGVGSWIYDYDGNGEADSEAGESAIGDNGYLIDMVGHNFTNGVAKKIEVSKCDTSVNTDIFDGRTGTLKNASNPNNAVYYIDDSSVDLVNGKTVTTVKVPTFVETANQAGFLKSAKDEKLNLYQVWKTGSSDAAENGKIHNEWCYVACSKTVYDNINASINATNTALIKKGTLYNAAGDASTATVDSLVTDTKQAVKLKKVGNDNTLYHDASVAFGNYACYNNNDHKVYIFKVQSGSTGSFIDTVSTLDASSLEETKWAVADADTSLVTFSYNGKSYGFTATGAPEFYSKTESGETAYWGVNFLSYNYISNTPDEVITNIHDVYYFNGKKRTSNDASAVELVDSSIFFGENPVSEDSLNMFIITDESEAAKITVDDYVQNISFNNKTGDATKYGTIPGVTRVIKKIFVNVTADNKFSYKSGRYTLNTGVVEPITTKSGKRGFYLITTIDSVLLSKSNTIVRQLPISSNVISKSLRFIPLKGLHISARHRPGYDMDGRLSVNDGIKKIYSVLEDKGIHRGLLNANMVDYRYIVDSMSYGIDNELGGKVYLSRLAADRGKSTALINAPSKAQFTASNDPVFCSTYDPATQIKPGFDIEYLATGGNVDMYSTRQFTLPTEDDGSKFAGVFYPHLVYRENNHNILVPPAADVSNTFVRKFQGGDPYAITANMDGLINNPSVINVEYDVDTEDRNVLEPMGINSIIRENGRIMIYGNQTCYQDTKSDFNKMHIRENLNTMEIAIENVLKTYNFKYNTPQVRASIITAVTPIMEAMKMSKAIDYYTLICDETNNTENIILDDLGILDVEVYFNHGMEKILQRIRVRKHSDIPVA